MPVQPDSAQMLPEDLPIEDVVPSQQSDPLAVADQQPEAIQELLERTPAVPPPDNKPNRPEKRPTSSESVEEEETPQQPRKRPRVSVTWFQSRYEVFSMKTLTVIDFIQLLNGIHVDVLQASLWRLDK